MHLAHEECRKDLKMTYKTKYSKSGNLILFYLLGWLISEANGAEETPRQEVPTTAQMSAGILPFFDNGNTILLGKEFRENHSSYAWMEFGGKQKQGETLAETAWREFIEETAGTLNIPFLQVQEAEKDGHYVDHFNEKSGMFYRMYCLKIGGLRPSPETFIQNAHNFKSVGKIEWQYFEASDVVYNQEGNLPSTDVKLYSTMLIRLEKLKDLPFLKNFIVNIQEGRGA